MKAAFLLAFAAFFLFPSIAFAAQSNQSAAGQSLSENLQLTSFTVSPPSIYQGDLAEFLLSVKSVGNTVSDFDASVIISDTSEKQVGGITFIHASIAGGETQDLSKIWDSAGIAAGNYSLIANITDNTGASTVLLSRLEILPAPSADQGNSQPAQGQPSSGAACPSQAVCEAPGNCVDNYTTQLCSYQGCPEKNYYLVQRCAPIEPPILLRAEGKICNVAPFICTDSQQEDWLTSFCLSSILILVVLLVLLLWRTRHYRL